MARLHSNVSAFLALGVTRTPGVLALSFGYEHRTFSNRPAASRNANALHTPPRFCKGKIGKAKRSKR